MALQGAWYIWIAVVFIVQHPIINDTQEIQ